MQPLLVMLVVGLTPGHLGPLTPRLSALAREGAMRPLRPVFPAVTCSVQASFLTGLSPRDHGIVGNGWFFRDLGEVMFWRQSNRLVRGEMIWDACRRRDPAFTCANMCWWYNMGAAHDYGLTPRPIYKADGRKLPDCYTVPARLRDELTARLGPFPLFQYWGPATSIASSRWIADATRFVMDRHRPTLTLCYLPHLDYDLQRHGPDPDHPRVAASLREVDGVAGDLIDAAKAAGRDVIVLSEYGITPVSRPVHINRALREAGFLDVRAEDGGEILDTFASRAFAVADHQVAHVYVRDPSGIAAVRAVLERLPGIERIMARGEPGAEGIAHERAGELIAVAERDAWFSYYYWLEDDCAPDFARTVEIHRKPGYDPAELFLDPAIRRPKLAVGGRLLRRKLGLRTLMDVIPLDASLVRGSHGRAPQNEAEGPLAIFSECGKLGPEPVDATSIRSVIEQRIFDS